MCHTNILVKQTFKKVSDKRIGSLCWFGEFHCIGILTQVLQDKDGQNLYYNTENEYWKYCRTVNPDEIMFYNYKRLNLKETGKKEYKFTEK